MQKTKILKETNISTIFFQKQKAKILQIKIKKLQLEVNRKSELEERFKQDIDDLSQETESLVSEINKWQM